MKSPPVIVVQLIHILGPRKGEIQEFLGPSILIGRHPSCDVQFPTDLTSVSRKHAEIAREGNRFKLIDHSTNGTFVNGKKVKETYLKNGDVVAFSEGGPKVSFLAEFKEVVSGEKQTIPSTFRPEPSQVPPEKSDLTRSRVEKTEPVQAIVTPPKEEPADVPVLPVNAPLVIQYGPTIRSFKELPVTLGKSPKCNFILNHPMILDQQAQIFFSQNQYWVRDITGQRVVQINRRPVGFQAPLKPNDELALSPQGPTFRFLGEGRLVESEEPPGEEPVNQGKQGGGMQPEPKDSKKKTSIFKKFFKE
jgi:pSer/pThr/pTyr-binding forkhead associated (FHA) protein